MKDEMLDDILGENNSSTVVDKNNEIEKVEYKPGVGVDIGTANIVICRQKTDGKFVNIFHRNMLYPLNISEEATDLLSKGNYLYVKSGNKFYVVGEDALSLSLAIGDGKGVIRPMRDGIISSSLKESSELLFFIIEAIVGKPIVPQEALRYTIPANSVDKENDNLFHQMVLGNFFKKLGYNAKPVNEAMCIIYDSGAVMKKDSEEVPLSGIATSWGAGCVNICLAYKGLNLVEFSCTRSGDNIDEQVEKVTGISRSQAIKIKENKLDLNNVDMNDRVQAALSIFYDETLARAVHHMTNKFKEKSSEMDGEIEIVVAGGTSMPKGFCDRLTQVVKESELPFKVYRVRQAQEPFLSVSIGACIRALGDQQKSIKK